MTPIAKTSQDGTAAATVSLSPVPEAAAFTRRTPLRTRLRLGGAAAVLLGPLAVLAHDGHGALGTWHLHADSLWPLVLLAGVVALAGILRGPRK